MKKVIAILIAVAALGVFLTGCKKDDAATTDPAAPATTAGETPK